MERIVNRAASSIVLAAAVLVAAIPGARAAQRVRAAIALPASAETAQQRLTASPRHGEWADVPIPGSDVKIHTWIVYPERRDKAPVVLVVHEIFGMSDWVRAVADQLAAEGFIAVAPDLLSGKGPNGGGTEAFPESDVMAAVSHLAPDEVAARLDAVRDYALSLPAATRKSAVIGFCWGGGVSFAYATHQPGLNAAFVYYGTPPSPAAMAHVACPVLGFYGGDDARVTSTVESTRKAMSGLKKPYLPHVYAGAGHGFLRQQTGRGNANLKAAQGAWGDTIRFMKQTLR